MTLKSRKNNKDLFSNYLNIADLSADAKVYVSNLIHSDVLVETSHKNIVDSIQMMKEQLRQDGKQEFMHCFRSIASAIRSVDVDKIHSGMRIGRSDDVQAWQDFCDDTVLHAVARFVLWKRMIPIQTHVEEYMKY